MSVADKLLHEPGMYLVSGNIEYTYVDLWAMKCGIARPDPTSHELRIK